MNNLTAKNQTLWWAVGIIGLALIAFLLMSWKPTPASGVPAVTDPNALPGIETSAAPWPAELTNLSARLKALGLPALSQEGSVLHIHQHIDIFVNGVAVPVPAGIGINEQMQFISPIHTHDDSAIIHIESPKVQTFTLGQFFDVWGLRFTNSCIGSYCASGDSALKVYVNGTLYSGDPRALVLAAHQEIVVAFGTDKQLPKSIPASYAFPGGE